MFIYNVRHKNAFERCYKIFHELITNMKFCRQGSKENKDEDINKCPSGTYIKYIHTREERPNICVAVAKTITNIVNILWILRQQRKSIHNIFNTTSTSRNTQSFSFAIMTAK